jgi:hypothetical protein
LKPARKRQLHGSCTVDLAGDHSTCLPDRCQ